MITFAMTLDEVVNMVVPVDLINFVGRDEAESIIWAIKKSDDLSIENNWRRWPRCVVTVGDLSSTNGRQVTVNWKEF